MKALVSQIPLVMFLYLTAVGRCRFRMSINLAEVRDTVFMISKLLNIKEVVVFGHGPQEEISDDLKKKLKMDAINAQLAAANPNSGINVLAILKKLIPKKWLASLRKNSKEERLKRLQKMLDEY